MDILKKETHPAIKLYVLMHFLIVYSQVMNLFYLADRYRSLEQSDTVCYLNIVVSISMILSIVLKKHRATIYVLVVSGVNSLFNKYLDFSYGPSIDITKVDLALSVSYSLVGWSMMFFIVLKSPIIKNYYKGLPSVEFDSKSGKRKYDLYKLLPKKYLIIGVSLLFILGFLNPPSYRKSLNSFTGWGENISVDGWSIGGDVEISVIENNDGDVEFSWEGRPISYIKIIEGSLLEVRYLTPIWASASLKKRDNCMFSPVIYKEIDTTCADSIKPTKLVPGEIYTVFIARNYDMMSDKKNKTGSGWASREFTID